MQVKTLPFFGGSSAVLTDETTFVKLDCEGAELALLGVENPDWRNVTTQ